MERREWVEVTVYGRPRQYGSSDAATLQIPAEGLRRAYTATPIAMPWRWVRGVHPTRYPIAWAAIDQVGRTSVGGRVAVTPVDIELRALSYDDGGGRHVFVVGTRDEVLTTLYGPQPTGVRLRAENGTLHVGGLRPGVHAVLQDGDVIDLDPVALAAAEWTVRADSQSTRAHVEIDNPAIRVQRHAGGGWQDVSTTLSAAMSSPLRLRRRPADPPPGA